MIAALLERLKNLEQNYPKFAEIPRGMEISAKSDTALNLSRQSLNDAVEAWIIL